MPPLHPFPRPHGAIMATTNDIGGRPPARVRAPRPLRTCTMTTTTTTTATALLLVCFMFVSRWHVASGSDRPDTDSTAPARSFLTTFISSVRHHRRSLSGDGRFVVHMIGALASVEGRVSWPYAGYEVCDRTTIVLVGRQMPETDPVPSHIDGCVTRHVRGEWNEETLEKGLQDERERRPDLVLLYNADAYTCPWRRTLHALLQPRDDLRHSVGAHRLGGPSGTPVVVTTYAAGGSISTVPLPPGAVHTQVLPVLHLIFIFSSSTLPLSLAQLHTLL